MEDNDVNEILERTGTQRRFPFFRSSRDRDTFSDDHSDTSSKHRYNSSRKTIQKSSTYESSVVTQVYNLRGGPNRSNRAHSETPSVDNTEQKRTLRSGQIHTRHGLVINGASVPVVAASSNEEVVKRHVRRESSRSANTSDYSSDEGNTLKGTAFPIYKQAGDWWDVFPKTDYTYSPASPDRKEIVPGIIPMPNMSRRSIHSDSSLSGHNSRFSASTNSNISHADSRTSWFGNNFSGTAKRRRNLVDADSDVDEADVWHSKATTVKHSYFSSITRIFTSIWTFLVNIASSLYQTVRRVLHIDRHITQRYYFNDIDSDVEDIYLPHGSRSSVRSSSLFTRILSIFTSRNKSEHRIFRNTGSHHTYHQTGDAPYQSWIEKLGVLHYLTVCNMLLLNTWLLSLFSRGTVHSDTQQVERPSRVKYLLLLLIPLLILAAWWWFSSDGTATENPVVTLVDSSSSKINTLWFLPVLFNNLWTSEKIILANKDESTGQEYAVDLEALVQKIVGDEDFQNLVLSEAVKRDEIRRVTEQKVLSTLQLQKESLEKELNNKNELLSKQQELHSKLADDVALMKQQMEELENRLLSSKDIGKDPIIDSTQGLWRREIRRLEDKVRQLEISHSTRPCCKVTPPPVPVVAIEEHVIKFLTGLFNSDGEAESKIPAMQTWLERLFVAKEDLESKLANISSSINLEVGEASTRSAQTIMSKVSDQIKREYVKQQAEIGAKLSEEKRNWVLPMASLTDNCSLTVSQVQDIVNNALNTYDADKTGMVDYALESSGGSIINTRCTDTYNARTATLSLLGVPLWWPSSNPRTVIQPGVNPGECWAFRGAQGYLVIRLSGRVKISAFSIEHIPVSLAPNGRIDSAPKDFSVWGLKNENDKDPEMLGRYTYRDNATSLQIFGVQRTDLPPFEIVELRIESNYGNLEYTCLYRFRVHGVLSKE